MQRPVAKELAKILGRASNHRSAREAFWALVNFAFCAIAKTTARTQEAADALEKQYMDEVARWPVEDVREVFPKAFALLAMHYPEMDRDHLGELAGEMEILSKDMGQFFTPMELCRLAAQLQGVPMLGQLKAKPFVTVHEPAAGAGAMLLAMAHETRKAGYDPMTSLWVEATELHHGTFQACYVALAMAGIPGRVTHGNTLSLETFGVHILPASRIFLNANGDPFAKPKPRPRPARKRVRPRPCPNV